MSIKLLGKANHIKNMISEIDYSKSKHEIVHYIQERLSNAFIFEFLPGLETSSDKLDSLIGKVCTNTISKARSHNKKRSYEQLKLYYSILKSILVSMGECEEWESIDTDVMEAFSEYIKNRFIPTKEIHIGKITIKEKASVSDAAGHGVIEFMEILNNIMSYFKTDYMENPENYVRELVFKVDLKDLGDG